MPLTPFHVALPCRDLAEARAFYGGLLGCPEGRSSDEWVDFDLHGHQIVAHLAPDAGPRAHNEVDGDHVPVPHFGAVLEWSEFHALADKLVYSKLREKLGLTRRNPVSGRSLTGDPNQDSGTGPGSTTFSNWRQHETRECSNQAVQA